jgi:predicted helicase
MLGATSCTDSGDPALGSKPRVRDTYIAASTARKTKRYDMYSRFSRWASDRIDENDIVAFITNRNFLDSREADGFRKIVAEEFNEILVIDLGGDARDDPRLSGTNIMCSAPGVAIGFMVKRGGATHCRDQIRGPRWNGSWNNIPRGRPKT